MKSRTITIAFLIMINLTSYCQQLPLNWSQKAGNIGWDYLNDIKRLNDNFFMGGSLKGIVPGDSSQTLTAFSNNAWLLKYDTMGNLIWQKTFGGRMFDNITSLATSNQGLYVAGIFQDTLNFAEKRIVCPAYSGGYLSRINENAEPEYLQAVGGKALISNLLITSKPDGNAFLAGSFQDSLFLAGNYIAQQGDKGIFIVRIQPDGTESLPLTMKCSGNSTIEGISSNDSLMCIIGTFSDTLHIADTTLISMGNDDAYIALFNQNNELQWVQIIGGPGSEQASSIILTPDNEVGIVGSFDYTALIDGAIIQSQGGKDIFVAVLNSSGHLKWLKSIGGTMNDYGYAITSNSSHEILVSGSYAHIIQLGSQIGNMAQVESFSPFGNSFIAKYDNVGMLRASYNLPGTSEDYCRKILAGDSEKITAIGNFFGTLLIPGLNADTTNLISTGEKDAFILQFADLCQDFQIDAGNDTLMCPGSSIILNAQGTFDIYQWTPGGYPNNELEVTTPGIYTLTVKDQNGCIARDSVEVRLSQIPTAFAGNDTLIEAGDLLYLTQSSVNDAEAVHWGTSGDGYFFNNELLNTTYSLSYNDVSQGHVILTLTASNICSSTSDSLLVTLPIQQDGISFYPNPTSSNVTLVCQEGLSIVSVTITRQSGEVIANNLQVNDFMFQFDLSPYPPGTYIFHVTKNDGFTAKVINKL